MIGPLIVLFGTTLLFADDYADRVKVQGSWLDQDSKLNWLIENEGESIRIVQSLNGAHVSTVECKLGSECQVKDGGHGAKVTLYFNGPRLVELETKGSETIKRRFSATDDAMEIEVIPIVPDGKAQLMKLKRVNTK